MPLSWGSYRSVPELPVGTVVSVRESEAVLLAPQKDMPCLLAELHALGADTAHHRQAPAEQWPNQLPTPHVKPPSETATDPWAGGVLSNPAQTVCGDLLSPK